MKIAVIGAGFCGLAACWHLLQTKKYEVTLFDSAGIGAEASGISAGLLHPYAGQHSKLNWQGQEGLAAAKELLKVSEEALGMKVADHNGILRPAFTQEQLDDFQSSASRFDDLKWLTKEETVEKIPGLPSVPSLFISSGITVDSLLYLKGLWKACENLGAEFVRREVHESAELENYGRVVCCLGAATRSFKETKDIPLRFVKGQILELEWPKNLPALPCTINSHVYITTLNGKCMAGSTFERGYKDAGVDPQIALELLLPKIAELYPPLQEAKVLNVKAGIRAVAPNHLPSLVKHSERLYSLTGMGSKGLLYHALMAKNLLKLIFS